MPTTFSQSPHGQNEATCESVDFYRANALAMLMPYSIKANCFSRYHLPLSAGHLQPGPSCPLFLNAFYFIYRFHRHLPRRCCAASIAHNRNSRSDARRAPSRCALFYYNSRKCDANPCASSRLPTPTPYHPCPQQRGQMRPRRAEHVRLAARVPTYTWRTYN